MAEINWLAVLLGALAFFLVGAIWYGVLLWKAWQKAAGLSDEAIQGGNMALIFGLPFLAEIVIALTLWHGIARSGASDRAVMMMAVGFGAFIVPGDGINLPVPAQETRAFPYRCRLLAVGMAAMGGCFRGVP